MAVGALPVEALVFGAAERMSKRAGSRNPLLILIFEQRRKVCPSPLHFLLSLLVWTEFTSNKGLYAERCE